MEVYAESMTLYKSQQTQNSGEQKMHIQISNSFLLNLQTNMINLLQILTTSFKKLVSDETSFKNNSEQLVVILKSNIMNFDFTKFFGFILLCLFARSGLLNPGPTAQRFKFL